jgi:hypothetical protein
MRHGEPPGCGNFGDGVGFGIAGLAPTKIEQTTFGVASGRSVPARIYSLQHNNLIFTLTVADLEGTNLEESAVIDHAMTALSQDATVRLNIPARIYQVYGRQLTVEGADGSRSMVQLFDYNGRLYQIDAKALPLRLIERKLAASWTGKTVRPARRTCHGLWPRM